MGHAVNGWKRWFEGLVLAISTTGLIHTDPHFVSGEHPNTDYDSIANALLATVIFRCWHLILAFTLWATLITLLTHYGIHDLSFEPTLITVLGMILGFVISYRTLSSFERYNEGRRYWSLVILHCRTMARTVWFHVPDESSDVGTTENEREARALIEKKSVLNLIEAYAVALKHYLRGEEGIHYADLYHLIRHLPSYQLPRPRPPKAKRTATQINRDRENSIAPSGPTQLLPSRKLYNRSLADVWPFSVFSKRRDERAQRKDLEAAMERYPHMDRIASMNIPLEVTLYLSSYIAALQRRKVIDVPTTNLLFASLNGLVDALSGLERIITSPIPWSYHIHLWTVCVLYCAALPFQLYGPLGFLTIPATAAVSFIFFGFLRAGEEIEHPFGFHRNDLNLDYFCHNMIRVEIAALTSYPIPNPAVWAFDEKNNHVLVKDPLHDHTGVRFPSLWVADGADKIRMRLADARQTSNYELHLKEMSADSLW